MTIHIVPLARSAVPCCLLLVVHLSDNKMTIMAIRSTCCCCCCWGCLLPVAVVVVTYVVHVHVIAVARCATKCIQLDFFPILPPPCPSLSLLSLALSSSNTLLLYQK